MLLVIVPLSLLVVTLVAVYVQPASDSAERSLLHALGDVVGFYIGYALLVGTVLSLVHTYVARRWRPSVARSTLVAGALGAVLMIPQALVFGPPYWGPSILTGALAGLIYGALTAHRWRSDASVRL